MRKRVCVVEDDRGLRERLRQVIEKELDLKFLGAYASAEEALPKILSDKPDIVLMDINLPGMSGIQCVGEIKKVLPDMQIIMVTVYEDSERIFLALKAGASGYLVKSSPPEQLVAAIRDAYNGGAPMSSQIARKVVRHFHTVGGTVSNSSNLSPREREVLDLLSMGLLYKQVGDKLKISPETVRTHVKHICEKMQVISRSEAIAKHRADK